MWLRLGARIGEDAGMQGTTVRPQPPLTPAPARRASASFEGWACSSLLKLKEGLRVRTVVDVDR
jgi:hypothetical protein